MTTTAHPPYANSQHPSSTHGHSVPPSQHVPNQGDVACGYFESSRDLAHGLDITVCPLLALPDGMVRELLRSRSAHR